MKSPHPQRLFYNSNKLSSIIQDKEHTAIMHGSQLPLAEKVLAGGDAVAHTRMLSTDRLDSTIVNSTNAEQHVLTFTHTGISIHFKSSHYWALPASCGKL